MPRGSLVALLAILMLTVQPPAIPPFGGIGLAQAQADDDGGDDDGGDDDDDDDDDDDGSDSGGGGSGPSGGSSGSGGAGASGSDDTGGGDASRGGAGGDDAGGDDSRGSGSGRDDRGPDDRGSQGRGSDDGADDAEEPDDRADSPEVTARAVVLPPVAPRIVGERGAGNRARRGEISGIDLDRADLQRLQVAGFEVLAVREVSVLGRGVAARLRPPSRLRDRRALELARETVPGAVFDLSHVYGASQGGARVTTAYGPELVRFASRQSCGRGLRVGMVDGAVADHPMLRGARISRKSFTGGNASAAHGTAVASVMVGRDPAGRALLENATLFSAAVFSREGGETSADAIDVAAALDWLSGQGVGVVNLSIAGPENAILAQTVARAADAGMIMVAAAGNGGAGGQPRYPAAYADVIAVSAVDQRGRPYRANTRGAHIDVAAPGVDIWAADARGGSGALWSGTSFAAPFVTVELAAARSSGAVRSAAGARQYLARSARDLGAAGPDSIFGVGLLQSRACR